MSAGAWKPIFIGHRGSYMGVMNTAEAYNNGVDHYGYQGLECDVGRDLHTDARWSSLHGSHLHGSRVS